MTSKKPTIGIVLDYETKDESQGGYSNQPWYALRVHYSNAVANNGGVPILIPYQEDLVESYVELCDGFIFPGGEYDINPEFYGKDPDTKSLLSTDRRTNFEIKLMQKVMEANKPMLGICAGEQLLNIILGGTLYQDIGSSDIQTDINHKPGGNTSLERHYIDIEKDSLLYSIVGKERYKVNTHHHQAVHDLGKDLRVSAVAPDGVIEAIEHTKLGFCLGVEWHPEYETNEDDSKIIGSLIQYANQYCDKA